MGHVQLRIAAIAVVSLLLQAIPCNADNQNRPKDPPADPKNIIGYRYDKNWWELGANIDDVELRGFKPDITDDQTIEVYADLEHPIRLGREKVDAHITLVFKEEVLGAIIIRTRDGGKNHDYYKQYYAKRFAKCTQIEQSDDRNSWLDMDDDSVTVESQPSYLGCPTEPPETVIIYLRRHVIQPNPANSMPQWLDNLIHGVSYAGVF